MVDFICLLNDDLTDSSVGRFQVKSYLLWKCCTMGLYSSIFSSTSTIRLAFSIPVYHPTDQWTDYSAQSRYERR
jgi:carbohydrate-selective porin OprB